MFLAVLVPESIFIQWYQFLAIARKYYMHKTTYFVPTGLKEVFRTCSLVLVFPCTIMMVVYLPINIHWLKFWAWTQQLGVLKTHLPAIWCISEAPETSVLELLNRRIQWCVGPNLSRLFHLFFKIILPTNGDGAWVLEVMNTPQQTLFIHGRGSVVVLLVPWQINVVCARFWWPVQLYEICVKLWVGIPYLFTLVNM